MAKSNVVCAIALSLILMATASSSTTRRSQNGVSPACLSTNHAQSKNGQQVEPKLLNADIVVRCNEDGTVCCIIDPEGRPPICTYTALRSRTEHAFLRSNVLERELKGLVAQSNR